MGLIGQMKTPYLSSGQKLKQIRMESGLTQEDLAKKAKLKTAQSISNIERGITPVPMSKLKVFSKALNVAPALLLEYQISDYKDWMLESAGIK